MKVTTETVLLKTLTASDGMVITDIATETMRAKTVILGKEDTESNYKEIDENTPLPESADEIGGESDG